MKKMNFTSITLRLTLTILAFVAMLSNIGAQCLEKLPLSISDPAACSVTLTAAQLVPAGATAPTSFTVKKPGATASLAVTSFTFTKDDIGTEFEVMSNFTGGGMCYTYVTILDSNKPVIPAAFATTIWCLDLVNGKVPAPGTVAPVSGVKMKQSDEATNVLGTRDATFDVNDCSSYTQFYTDVYGAVTTCPTGVPYTYQTVTRTWIFKDKWGNTSDPLVETIIVTSGPLRLRGAGGVPDFTLIGNGAGGAGSTDPNNPTIVSPLTISCTVGARASDVYGDWDISNAYTGTIEDVQPGRDYCGRSYQVDEMRMPICGGTMITRTYKVNNCGVITYYRQVINVVDYTSPSASFSFTDYLRVPEEICRDTMNGAMIIYRNLYKTVIENRTVPAAGATGTSVGQQASRAIKISPLMDVDGGCNTATVRMTMVASDPSCTGGKVTIYAATGSPLRFNGMPIMEVDGGTSIAVTGTYTSPGVPSADVTDFIYIKDACGNITEVKVTVIIIDNITPNSYCEDKQVSLTNNKGAVVNAKVFSFGKQDNCTSENKLVQYIRKTGTSCWKDNLVLNCGDNFKVDIITIDSCLNYNICCVNVTTVDKVPSTCLSPADRTVACNSTSIANINGLFGTPTVYSNCTAPTVAIKTDTALTGCGEGTYTRTWTYTLTNDAGTSTSVCKQKITLIPVKGYRVKPLASQTLNCGGYVYDEATERANALANIKLLNGQTELTCSAPVVEVEKWEYSNTQYCKIIRIRYTFVDKCSPYCGIRDDVYNNAIYLNYGDTDPEYKNKLDYTTRYDDGYFQAQSFNTYCTNANALFFGYERFVKISDNTKPTSVAPTIVDICFPDNRCNFDFSTTLTGSDRCDDGSVTGSNLAISWTVRAGTSATGTLIASGSGVTTSATGVSVSGDALKNLAGGLYTVRYVIADFCGNTNAYSFTFRGKDCKTPFVLVHEKNLSLGYDLATRTGMGTVCYVDVLNAVGDNCTDVATLESKVRLQKVRETGATSDNVASYNLTDPNFKTCIQFSCADKGQNVPVRVWTQDNAGNANFVLTYINVTDPQNACSVVPLANITGTLKTENNQAVKDVVVTSSINGAAVGTGTTDAAGSYALTATLDQNVQVKAVKIATEDKYAGVTTFDIARISKHLLDIEKFTSPYSMIAADVNKDGEVDATDMLQIRNFILRKSTTLPGGVWRFVDASYKFTNPANPFGEDFPEVVNLSKVPATAAANFTAIKLGDVNTTYVSALTGVQVRNSNALVLQAEDMQLVAGNEYTVNITADNFNAIAFQGTISLNGATVKSVKAGDLANYNDGNFGVFANEITTSWNGASKLNANVMSITFVANKSAKLSEVMTVGNSLTPAVANDIAGNEMNVNLKFTTGKVAGGEFALYQNTPNPVALETTIGFNLPKDESARLTVYSVDGKTILTKQVAGKAGLNQFTINKSELNANGVMYYRLETAEHTATKKMVIIE